MQPTHSSQRYIIAHDLGTSGNKATLFDDEGRLVESAFAPYATIYPHANWAEQDPADWWDAICTTTRRLLAGAGIDPRSVAAVGFSGMMMGCLPVDEQGRPLRSCIIWADQRAQVEAAQMAELCGSEEVYRRCGQRSSPAYCAPKMLWVRTHQPEIFARTHKFLVPKDFVVHRLTGVFATDYSDASGTLLFDLHTRCWHAPFLQQLGLDEALLPAIFPSTAVVGEVTAAAAAATGLAMGTPVVIGGGDGATAGIGAGVVDPGSAYCVIGTSAWISISALAPMPDLQQRTMTFHHVHPERYAPMGVQQLAGGARAWAWQALAGDVDLDSAAAAVAPGAGGLLFLPYLMGERSPLWNPLARGSFIGLTIHHGKPEMARAVLEGVAFGLCQILDALREQSPSIPAVRLIGGGSKSEVWPQILADIFGLPVHPLALKGDANSWGAAMAAGVGVGLYSWSLASARSQVERIVEPNLAAAGRYAELYGLFGESYRALEGIFTKLAPFGG